MKRVGPHKPTLSIVLPTIGRPGLELALDGIRDAGFLASDELVAMADGRDQEQTCETVCAAFPQARTFRMADRGGWWGHPGRNRGMLLAEKEAIMFTQDDQLLVPGCLSVIRDCLKRHEDWASTGHMFQVVPQAGNMCFYSDQERRCGHIDADCVVLPRVLRSKFSRWGNDYNGDHSFIMETMDQIGVPFAYHHVLISVNHNYVGRYQEVFHP